MREETIGSYQIGGVSFILAPAPELNPGKHVDVPLNSVLQGIARPKPDDEIEVQVVVFRYRDLNFRPFHLFYYVNRYPGDANQRELVLMPMVVSNGSAIASGPKHLNYRKVRDALRQLCIDSLDLPETAGYEQP